MPEFLQNDLVNLAKANIYIKLMIDGVSSKPFSATTLPPHIEPLVSYKDIIIKNTREHYGTPRKIVDARIASEWQANSDTAINEKIGRRDEKPLAQVLRPSASHADGRSIRPSVPPSISRAHVSSPLPVSTSQPVDSRPSISTPAESVVRTPDHKPAHVSETISVPPSVPSAPAPKQFIRQKVDIEALRRSINESLKKQSESETPSQDSAASVEKKPE